MSARRSVRRSVRCQYGDGFGGACPALEPAMMAPTGGPTAVTDLDFGRFEALTFDCYGTLIDWETGIVAGLRPGVRGARPRATGRRPARGVRKHRIGRRSWPVPALPRDPRPRTPWDRGRLRVRARRRRGRRVRRFGRRVAGFPGFGGGARAAPRALPPGRHHELRRRPVRPFGGAPRDGLRLGRHGAIGRELQAGRAQLRGRLRADRAPARAHPARRPEPLPRPRPGQAARPHDRLDRPPPRPARNRRDPARRRRPGCHLPGYGLIRRGGYPIVVSEPRPPR